MLKWFKKGEVIIINNERFEGVIILVKTCLTEVGSNVIWHFYNVLPDDNYRTSFGYSYIKLF